MSDRTDALRYARELFEVTWRQGQAAAVADELDAFAEASRGGDRAMPLFHPLVPKADKLAAIRAIIARAGISRPTAVLIEALVQHHLLHLLPRIAAGFRDRLNRRDGVVHAKVTTAAPLPAEKTTALGERLSALTGRQVALQTRVDPTIIGGVVTQIDSTVYDGSVTRQLARMRQKLVENV